MSPVNKGRPFNDGQSPAHILYHISPGKSQIKGQLREKTKFPHSFLWPVFNGLTAHG